MSSERLLLLLCMAITFALIEGWKIHTKEDLFNQFCIHVFRGTTTGVKFDRNYTFPEGMLQHTFRIDEFNTTTKCNNVTGAKVSGCNPRPLALSVSGKESVYFSRATAPDELSIQVTVYCDSELKG